MSICEQFPIGSKVTFKVRDCYNSVIRTATGVVELHTVFDDGIVWNTPALLIREDNRGGSVLIPNQLSEDVSPYPSTRTSPFASLPVASPDIEASVPAFDFDAYNGMNKPRRRW